MTDETYFDEETLFKVYKALVASGLNSQQSQDAVTTMQNVGILFRERIPNARD